MPGGLPPSRRTTGASQGSTGGSAPYRRRTTSDFAFQARQAAAQSSGPKLYAESFTLYELPWEKLKQWLENRFQGYTFEKKLNIHKDCYLFNIPEPLTQDERQEILKLKNLSTIQRESPEPV